jgi:hypothetical protein
MAKSSVIIAAVLAWLPAWLETAVLINSISAIPVISPIRKPSATPVGSSELPD